MYSDTMKKFAMIIIKPTSGREKATPYEDRIKELISQKHEVK